MDKCYYTTPDEIIKAFTHRYVTVRGYYCKKITICYKGNDAVLEMVYSEGNNFMFCASASMKGTFMDHLIDKVYIDKVVSIHYGTEIDIYLSEYIVEDNVNKCEYRYKDFEGVFNDDIPDVWHFCYDGSATDLSVKITHVVINPIKQWFECLIH